MKKNCPKCRKSLKEVRKVYDPNRSKLFKGLGNKSYFFDYPKGIVDSKVKKKYNEYRFACPDCKNEWVYYSSNRIFEDVPKDSTYRYSWSKGVLVKRKK